MGKGEARLIEHSAFHVIGYRETVFPHLSWFFIFILCFTVGISRLIYMLSAVSESSHLGAESLFHTYCLIELRTSLALECKSPELNLDELRRVRVGEMGEREKQRERDSVYVCVWEREAKERKFRITKCRIPLKKGEIRISRAKGILCKFGERRDCMWSTQGNTF